MRRVVVVGAGLAGHNVAEHLRKKGFDGGITVVGDETHLPYDRPPLSKDCLWSDQEPVPRTLGGPGAHTDQGITVLRGTAAHGLDATGRRVRLTDGTDLPYDALVVATGARARTLPALGGLAGVHTLRTFDDCLRIRAALAATPRVVIVGAGLIGCEVAGAAAARGFDVTLVDPLPAPMAAAVGTVAGERVAALQRDAGVTLRPGASVTGADGDGRVEAVRPDAGDVLPADLVLVAVGAVPNTGWLAGFPVGTGRGVLTDERCRTAVADVYAVGDVAETLRPRTGRHAVVEHWSNAREQGAAVACEILGEPAPAPALPYFWSDQAGGKIQGLGRLDAPETLTGALSVDAAGRLMRLRPLIEAGAPWDAAEALVLG